jgi:putative oxidoreductase
LRRLFSSFARGLPGVGLLLLRLVTGVGLLLQGATILRGPLSIRVVSTGGLAAISGIFLLVGLWTPIAGVLAALVEFSAAYVWYPHDPWTYFLLGFLGISLALLGPGFYSVDARLFGWKRIDIPDRKS